MIAARPAARHDEVHATMERRQPRGVDAVDVGPHVPVGAASERVVVEAVEQVDVGVVVMAEKEIETAVAVDVGDAGAAVFDTAGARRGEPDGGGDVGKAWAEGKGLGGNGVRVEEQEEKEEKEGYGKVEVGEGEEMVTGREVMEVDC